jgi:sec-independent protein translocase protein TatC
MTTHSAQRLGRGGDHELPPGEEDEPDDKPMTFWEHLEELRRRLIWSVIGFFAGCCIAWGMHERLLAILRKPFDEAWIAQNLPGKPNLHFSAVAGAFQAYFKLAMIGGGALAAPFIFYQLWKFVAPGLYAREKRFIIPFVGFSTVLFIGGGYFGWRVVFPISFNYFLSLSQVEVGSAPITPTVMMNEYIDFCAQMLLAFGIIFEMPLLLFFLSIAGLINYLHLLKFARYFILVAFIVAAVFTPPDVTSQLAMAVPMCLLYAFSIGIVRIFGKPPTEAQLEAWRNRKKKKVATEEA